MDRNELGRWGEAFAAEHLEADGCEVLARNWRCREGELDLVVRDGNVLVFVEVKTRSGIGFGSPAEAITAQKARRLRVLAQHWLAVARPPGSWELRFDLVGIVRKRGWAPELTHLRGAF